jgi:hypothetical protein
MELELETQFNKKDDKVTIVKNIDDSTSYASNVSCFFFGLFSAAKLIAVMTMVHR